MRGHYECLPLTTFNFVKLHNIMLVCAYVCDDNGMFQSCDIYEPPHLKLLLVALYSVQDLHLLLTQLNSLQNKGGHMTVNDTTPHTTSLIVYTTHR